MVVTLTTDFGGRDPYVAAMKGVILSRCPDARVVDLSHEIGAQDLLEAALFVAEATPRFPPETIHVVVVDPGVGTRRRPLIVACGGHLFVCPDNGVLTMLVRNQPIDVEAGIQ